MTEREKQKVLMDAAKDQAYAGLKPLKPIIAAIAIGQEDPSHHPLVVRKVFSIIMGEICEREGYLEEIEKF